MQSKFDCIGGKKRDRAIKEVYVKSALYFAFFGLNWLILEHVEVMLGKDVIVKDLSE